MKTYERFLAERIQDPKPTPFNTNRNSPPVSSRTGLGINPKAAKQLDTQRKNTQAQNSTKSFLGSIKSKWKPSVNTQSKAPSFNAKPNVNYSGRTGNAKGNQSTSGLI